MEKIAREKQSGLSVERALLSTEATMFQSLPLSILNSFQATCLQLVPRVSMAALTIHIMLLTPVLRFIKKDPFFASNQVHIDVIPLLYLAPIVFVFPFVMFSLWENDLLSVGYIDDRLGDFVHVQRSQAVVRREQEEAELVQVSIHIHHVYVCVCMRMCICV